jgi:hypothetical protein
VSSQLNQKIKKSLFLFLISSTAFALRFFPTLWAYLRRGKKVFMGIVSGPNLEDLWTYLAEVMMGKKGHFLLLKEYGTDPQEAFFIRTLYLYLGQLARVFSLRVETAYFLAAYFFCLALAWSLFSFSQHFFKKISHRLGLVALTLLTCSLIVPEAQPFLSLLQPHFILSHICLIWLAHFCLDYYDSSSLKPKPRKLILIFFSGLVLSSVHVFMNWLMAGLFFFWALFSSQAGSRSRFSLWPVFSLVASSLPMTTYLLYLQKSNSFFNFWLESNVFSTLSGFFFLSQLGIFLFLIPFALVWVKKNKKIIFLFFWFLIPFLFLFSPLTWRRRFFEGWWLPSSSLALLGFLYLYPRLKKMNHFFQTCLFMVCAPFLLIGTLGTILLEINLVIYHPDAFYTSTEMAEAWAFLQPNCNFSKIVFTDKSSGVQLPAKSGCRANIGHPHLTFNFEQRESEIKKLKAGEASSREIASLFQKQKIDFVFFSREIAQKAGLQKVKNLKLVFENEEFVIYETL